MIDYLMIGLLVVLIVMSVIVIIMLFKHKNYIPDISNEQKYDATYRYSNETNK